MIMQTPLELPSSWIHSFPDESGDAEYAKAVVSAVEEI
jgi:hypothetical protein